MSKLISEPPLLVLPSLAREVGLTDAIVLQQLHYAGGRTADGWVERSAGDWARAMRGVISQRSLERIFPKLVESGWVEARATAGKPTAYRVTPDKLAEEVPPTSGGSPPPSCGGGLSREGKEEKTPSVKRSPRSIVKLEDEPDGFAQWLAHHVEIATLHGLVLSVPKPETSYRSALSRTYLQLVTIESYVPDDIWLASEGVLADAYMREHGHVKPDNVLRKEKIGRRIEDGRAWRAKRSDGPGKYDHLG